MLTLPARAGERFDTVVRDLHVNGYSSVADAVTRLQAADDRPGAEAPLAKRHRYYAALGEFASFDLERKPSLSAAAREALEHLEAMAAREDCRSCTLDARMTRARLAFSRRDTDEAARILAGVDATGASAEQLLRLHLLRGRQYRQQGLFAQGVAEVVPAMELARRLGYIADRIVALNLLTTFNGYLGDYARAEAYGREAYALGERIGSRRLMTESQLNLGFTYSLSGQTQRQLQAYLRGLERAGDAPDTAANRIVLLSNLADYWLRKEDYRQALDYARSAEALALQMDDALGLMFSRTNAGVARAHLGDVDGGISNVREAIAIAERKGMPVDVIGVTQELAGILEFAGRYREALAELRKLESLQREVTRQERDKAVLELQERYSAEKRQREIEQLAATNRVKEAQLSVQAWQRRLWAALALALALAAVVLVQWLKRVRSANRRLSDDVAVLAEQSTHDPLTDAFNRRQGHNLLARHAEALRAAAPGEPPALGLVLLDIDFFKHINDTYGHAAGDQVLVEVVKRLRGLLRMQDAVVRWGGEEFLLLLPNVQAGALPMLAGRMLHALADVPVAVGGAAVTVTASAGCVASPFGSTADFESLVQLADLALYRAKLSGRNQAVCVGGATPDLDAAALGQNLVAASTAGKLVLEIVTGPLGPRHAGGEESQEAAPIGTF
ncbi:GGDEF domain-containing protein [Thermomonas brevis]|uniref:diguanylate cyclase n=1 Tax=Thermomonas brevis TaxID=215691 RepID=A0A7G9QR12_9GAMM|nr:GGDEF domain-containing protein [Thermomonas brevis]QNN45787.1 GGDEF domain-containing protein [Thermomonas brevis]